MHATVVTQSTLACSDSEKQVTVINMEEMATPKDLPKKMSQPKSETTFSSHLQGKKHKANYEELKPNLPEPKNKGFPTSTPKET